MPQQEMFFEQRIGDRLVTVLKSYDAQFARQAFDMMEPHALSFLGKSFDITDTLAPTDLDNRGEEDLWEDIQACAREDWNTFSYFIVMEVVGETSNPVFVSADWPTSEAYAKTLIPL